MTDEFERLQRDFYKQIEKRANELEGKTTKEFKLYQKSFTHAAKRKFTQANHTELSASINRNDVIYIGDVHTFRQNVKNLIRILTKLTKYPQLLIGVEFAKIEHQQYIDKFLSDEINEFDFLEGIEYKESWKFPWQHYKNIFNFAKEHNIRIISLNSEGTLRKRDKTAAKVIASYLNRDSRNKMVVFFGEYHLVKDKLPSQVLQLAPSSKSTLIHQNLDAVYKKLKTGSRSSIVKFTKNEFSLQTTAPWLKYESIVYWYENLSDNPDFDLHQYIIENKIKTFSDNVVDEFMMLCTNIKQALNLDISDCNLQDFSLYDHRKLSFIEKEIKKTKNFKIIQFYKKLIKNGKSFKIPHQYKYYCSNYSINKMSFLAGAHIYNIFQKQRNPNYEEYLFSASKEEQFYFFVSQSMMSYFCSKVINPYQKCDLYQDILKRIKELGPERKKRKNLELVLEILDDPTNIQAKLSYQSLRGIHSMSKTLGNMIADVIFDDLYIKDSNNFEKLKDIIFGKAPNKTNFQKIVKTICSGKTFQSKQKRIL